MQMNRIMSSRKRIVAAAVVLVLVAFAGDAFAAAALNLKPSPASGWIPSISDNKHRFTVSLQNEFQDATTVKQFKVTIKNSAGSVIYTLPAAGDSGTQCTMGNCVYLTNGTTYTGIRNPALSWGSYKIEGSVTVYGKKADGSADTNNQRLSLTNTIDYSVPKPYGWFTAIDKYNAPGISVTTKLGSAEDALDGHTLGSIVRDANTKVRGDNKACQECHGPGKTRPQWDATTMTKDDFCANRVAGFHSSVSKPQVLKDLFNVWKQRGCPD